MTSPQAPGSTNFTLALTKRIRARAELKRVPVKENELAMSSASRFLITVVAAMGIILPASRSFAGPLTIEQLLDIRHPSDPVWSPDGKRIAFLWDRCDVVNLYVVDGDGKRAPIPLTQFSDSKVTNPFWSADGSSIYFVDAGKLW